MSDLDIKAIDVEDIAGLATKELDISLKLDGTLIYFKDKKLFSPRCERSDRYKHILDILIKNKFPNCVGEMFIDKLNANVFDISKRENWEKACFLPFDFLDTSIPYLERFRILDEKVKEINNPHIFRMIRFKTFQEGWNFVRKHNSEGLVLRNNTNWFKIKLLKEVQMEIVGHEQSKVKGTFILKNGSHISGTSAEYVRLYKEIVKAGKKPIAEIEYPFLTREGRYFQPRLRRIYVEGEK